MNKDNRIRAILDEYSETVESFNRAQAERIRELEAQKDKDTDLISDYDKRVVVLIVERDSWKRLALAQENKDLNFDPADKSTKWQDAHNELSAARADLRDKGLL